ncbi:hypothetical protein ACKFKF_22830 [Phormidesmis sp. 146-12]
MTFDAARLGQWIRQIDLIDGCLVIWAIVFTELGLVIDFFLPEDGLRFAAEFSASQTILNLEILTLGCFVAAVLGDSVECATGSRFGRNLFDREDSWLFYKKHLVLAQRFYQKCGKRAIVLAQFVPIVRTFAPIVTRIRAMNYVLLQSDRRTIADFWRNAVGLFFKSHDPRCR